MDNLMQNEAEMKEPQYEESFGSTKGAETNQGTSVSIKDPDTMLSMIVLLLACLVLATLANLFV